MAKTHRPAPRIQKPTPAPVPAPVPTLTAAPALALEALLSTNQPEEQVRRVQSLIQVASTPDVFLCIHVDKAGQVSLKAMGMPLTSQDVHRVLDAARAEMIWLEVSAATPGRQQQQPGSQPEPTPDAADAAGAGR